MSLENAITELRATIETLNEKLSAVNLNTVAKDDPVTEKAAAVETEVEEKPKAKRTRRAKTGRERVKEEIVEPLKKVEYSDVADVVVKTLAAKGRDHVAKLLNSLGLRTAKEAPESMYQEIIDLFTKDAEKAKEENLEDLEDEYV